MNINYTESVKILSTAAKEKEQQAMPDTIFQSGVGPEKKHSVWH
jgi:hypothetical protein